MPLPFLLTGLGVAAGLLGVGGHLSAKETNEKAQGIAENARELYNNAKHSLEEAQNETERNLLTLGYEKKNVLDTSMKQFLSTYDKIKHIQVTESVGINEISKFVIDSQDAIEIRQLTDIYSSSIKSGVTGAAAGTIIALAASGALPIVTGTLATAGSALLAGEVGAAVGIAGSALSFGAAMTPLAAVAAPVVLFTGISASMKADENLEKAVAMHAEAEAAAEKMQISEVLCYAISERAEMFNDLLVELNEMFAECSGLLAGVVKKKQGRIFKKKLTSDDFSEEDIKLIAVTRSLAGAVKAVIDTPILSEDGEISYEGSEVYEQTVGSLPSLGQAVDEIRDVDYEVKPVTVKTEAEKRERKNGILKWTRNVAAIVLGVVFATVFAKSIASSLRIAGTKYLFWDANIVNTIAIWLLIASAVTMIVGAFSCEITEKICIISTGVSLFILYTQYCRTVGSMEHYFIFSVAVFIVSGIVSSFVTDQVWESADYLECLFHCFMIIPISFAVYVLFAKWLGFSDTFWLVVSSVGNGLLVAARCGSDL